MKNNIILKKLGYLFLSFAFVSSFVACDQVESVPDESDIKVEEVTGHWYVQVSVDGDLVADYFQISIYNTSANDGTEIWLDDHKNFWWFKFKTPINLSSMSFSGTNLASSVEDDDSSTPNVIETYDIDVNVTNGIIVKKGTTASGSGTVVDSISFDIEFSDDPGTIYQIAGYKATGFIDDNH
ncbi:Lipid-binding putative hydrolase [Mariniflexile rhizosphaerae]|uniref:lipid-binding protein n=1 Tax=unclassified Mariniflexile TaxID=2643887 RepID=UPI000CB8F8EF|nr:lipid-binding protein [Mariniflexile sp. TRM1-10]AXP79602.1 Lipid-binding putative hydrolase [Mariniflexile sp. TRM1-10]PLB18563.1 MAG: Lipid_bd domain containing protein [Flavobacteriaceae bacterium FS1-H7996/R]